MFDFESEDTSFINLAWNIQTLQEKIDIFNISWPVGGTDCYKPHQVGVNMLKHCRDTSSHSSCCAHLHICWHILCKVCSLLFRQWRDEWSKIWWSSDEWSTSAQVILPTTITKAKKQQSCWSGFAFITVASPCGQSGSAGTHNNNKKKKKYNNNRVSEHGVCTHKYYRESSWSSLKCWSE